MLDLMKQKILRLRGSWIAFMVILPILSVATGIYAGFSYANRSTPDKTLRIDSEVNLSPGGMLATFCNALKSGDYRTAYARFVEQYQHRYPAQQFQADLFIDKIISCTYGSISISGRDGLAIVTFAYSSGVVDNDVVTLTQDATNIWRIENGIKLATPRKTLSMFCSAMQSGDYQTAYDQFSSDFQDMLPEQEFAAIFAQNKVISCTYGSLGVSGASATAMLKLANTASLAYSAIVTLVQQDGNDWKIDRVVLQ